MAKRPTKPSSRTNLTEANHASDNESFTQKAANVIGESKRIMHTDRFKVICGLLLVFVVIFLFITFI